LGLYLLCFLCVFLVVMVSDWVCVRGVSPCEGWKFMVIVMGRLRPLCWAFLSAALAGVLGVTVKLTVPAAAMVMLDWPKTILAGRHLPLSLMWPVEHLLAVKAPTLRGLRRTR
jgi:hypothetical protein